MNPYPQISSSPELQFFSQKPLMRWLIIGFLFITALGIRLYQIEVPPMDFHPTRQYHSALIARSYYYETSNSIPEWRKQVALINAHREGTYEPPIMEIVVSFAYGLTGGEHLWIPRLLSSLFWLIGGMFLYLIAKKLSSMNAGRPVVP